jgi:hypothetical protein
MFIQLDAHCSDCYHTDLSQASSSSSDSGQLCLIGSNEVESLYNQPNASVDIGPILKGRVCSTIFACRRAVNNENRYVPKDIRSR